MQRSDFEFELPPELIAQHPLPERSASRLLRLDGASGLVSHHIFRELPGLLTPGDLLVFNDTRVMPARLALWRATGGRVELLVERVLTPRLARCHARPARSLKPGDPLFLAAPSVAAGSRGAAGEVAGEARSAVDAAEEQSVRPAVHQSMRAATDEEIDAAEEGSVPPGPVTSTTPSSTAPGAALPVLRVRGRDAEGLVEVETPPTDDWPGLMARFGAMPLPPYIDRPPVGEDSERYQTVYAERPGAVAAPTAGLHFDEALLARLTEVGIHSARLTLHVGAGTFQPVREGDVAEHHMHAEWYEVPPATAEAVRAARARGGRVVAVGTTSVRALESAASEDGLVAAGSGETSIFITPGYRFRAVDALITNFHLPGSTLVMLVAAFAGREHILSAYAQAIRERYRFFSYGDAMLITPAPAATRGV